MVITREKVEQFIDQKQAKLKNLPADSKEAQKIRGSIRFFQYIYQRAVK